MGGFTTRNMYSSLQRYNKLYIVASCWTIIDIVSHLLCPTQNSPVITQRVVVIPNWCLGTIYRSHLQELRTQDSTLEDGTDSMSRNVCKELVLYAE